MQCLFQRNFVDDGDLLEAVHQVERRGQHPADVVEHARVNQLADMPVGRGRDRLVFAGAKAFLSLARDVRQRRHSYYAYAGQVRDPAGGRADGLFRLGPSFGDRSARYCLGFGAALPR